MFGLWVHINPLLALICDPRISSLTLLLMDGEDITTEARKFSPNIPISENVPPALFSLDKL
jgi:hypothetical protein